MKRFATTTAVLALMAGMAGAASHGSPAVDGENVEFSDTGIVFENVTAANDGHLVIHEVDESGDTVAPASIASAPVKAGENARVEVRAPEGVHFEEGKSYTAMLHDETNGNDSYDFAEGSTDVDTPTMNGSAAVVSQITWEKKAQDEMSDMDVSARTSGDADRTNPGADDDGAPGTAPMIDVTGLTIDGATVTFDKVVAATNGYLVIHTAAGDRPLVPGSLASTPVQAGENTDVSVTIPYPFVSGETYVAMLHEETDGDRTYDFDEGSTDVDMPVMRNGEVVAERFGG